MKVLQPVVSGAGRALERGPGTTLIFTLVFLFLAANCDAQGTLTVSFDGQSPGTTTHIFGYSESGVDFGGPYAIPLGNFWLNGDGIPGYPSNGSGYLELPAGSPVRVRLNPLAPFSLISFDVAELTNLPGPVSLTIVGYKFDSSIVTNYFTTDGINDGVGGAADFQTVTFGTTFQNLYQVDVLSSMFAIDNVIVGTVPEPSAGALALVGVLCVAGRFKQVRRSRRHEVQ